MQKIFLGLISLLFFSTVYSQDPSKAVTKIVGKLENGVPVLTIDKQKAIAMLTTKLRKYSQLQVSYTDVKIEKFDDKYALIFFGGETITTFAVETDRAAFIAFVGTSCTTSECVEETRGCIVRKVADQYYCQPCANKGKCTKTSTSDSLIDDFDF